MSRLALFALLLFACPLDAQLSVSGLELPYGPQTVGYHHYIAYDSTRTYNRTQDWTNETTARPIPVSVWYPALPDQPAARYLGVFDYLRLMSVEEEWEHLPNDLIMSWFEFPNSPENQQRVQETTRAILDPPMLPGKFPVVIYAASFLASSTENFALCEMLASHGFLVLASPGRGADSRPMYGTAVRNSEGQARDLEFLLHEAARHPFADTERMGAVDYSFGGLATAITQMRDTRIKAMVSLDGRSRYDYNTIFSNPTVNIDRFNVPFMHLAQKVIPDSVLLADEIPPSLNTEFLLFDSLRYSDAYAVRLHDLSHRHFSTMGLLLKSKDVRQDKSDVEAMAGHRTVATFTLRFLEAHLKDDPAARQFLTEQLVNGANDKVSVQHKEPIQQPYDFRDFNDQAKSIKYQGLDSLYRVARAAHPSFSIPEWQLNQLGLQLGFNLNRTEFGVRLFEFAIRLYPESGNLHDSLAEVLLNAGELKKAATHFRKSLELDPENGNARQRLAELDND